MNIAQLLTRETSYFAATQVNLTGDFFCYALEVLYSFKPQYHIKLSNCHDSFIHSTAKTKKVKRSLVWVAYEGQFSFHSESSVSYPDYFVHDSKSSLNHPSANKGLKISLTVSTDI